MLFSRNLRLPQKKKRKAQIAVALLFVATMLFALYGVASLKTWSAFYDNVDSWSGDFSISGIEVGGDLVPINNVARATLDYDGDMDFLRIWRDNVVQLQSYPGLEGYPGSMPQMTIFIGDVVHVDGNTNSGRLPADIPSVYGSYADGKYYEIFYYNVDLVFRLHADMYYSKDYDEINYFRLTFQGSDFVSDSTYVGEYGPMLDVYALLSIDLKSYNASIIEIGADLAARGAPRFYFLRNTGVESWSRERLSRFEVRDQLNDAALTHNAVLINRMIAMAGFDSAQGFSVRDIDEDNDIWTFDVGFDMLGVPGYYYLYYSWFMRQENMVLYDVEIVVPMQIGINIVYDIDTNLDGRVNNKGNTEGYDPDDPYYGHESEADWKRDAKLIAKDVGLLLGVPEEYALLGGVAVIAVIAVIIFKD